MVAPPMSSCMSWLNDTHLGCDVFKS
jgi:hypothetical protein